MGCLWLVQPLPSSIFIAIIASLHIKFCCWWSFFFLRIFTTYRFALNRSAIVIIFWVHTSTSYNSLTVIFVVTCTFEVSETCLPDEWIGVNKKKTTNICTDSQGSKFRKLRACSTPTTQKVWLRITMEK